MKGRMVLEKKIKKILKPFKVKTSLYEQFMYSQGWIFFPFYECPELGKFHRDWILNHFHIEVKESEYFLFSLLHEVGHHYTIPNMTAEEKADEMILRTFLGFSEDTPKQINEAYFNLPAEMLATEWALSYMEKHKEWCKKESRKIYEALRHFGNLNGWDL